MSNLSSFVKRIRDVMRNDAGINGDAQRIEQIAWMLFLKVYDAKEEDWEFEDEKYESIIPEELRWRNWAHTENQNEGLTGDPLLNFVNNELFPTLKKLVVSPDTPIRQSIVRTTFEDANNYMKDGVLLRQIINIIDELDFGSYEETHAFGEIYETILKELQSAGSAGEFYTPRAVTQFMAKMIKPQIGETMADFACGTGGFLSSWIKELEEVKEAKGSITNKESEKIYNSIYGIEKKQFPYMLCVTNMLLHGIDSPKVFHDNSLTKKLLDYTQKDAFDVILMNPPYGGSEKDDIKQNFPADLRSSETADLFMAVIMYRLKKDGRAAVIVPDGFLFGNDNAKNNLKKKLLTDFNLHTIIRLPGSVFSPYTSITTNILFFNNEEPTGKTWFYRVDIPSDRKHFSKTKPMELKHFDDCIVWWKDRKEITDQEGNPKAKCFTSQELIDSNYNFDVCGYPHEEEEILSVAETIQNFEENKNQCFNNLEKIFSEFSNIQEQIKKGNNINLNISNIKRIDFSFLLDIRNKMKKAILQEAVQGKLVPQIASEGNAKDLLEEIKKEKAKLIKEGKIKKEKPLPEITEDEISFDIPENWCWCRLGELLKEIIVPQRDKPKEFGGTIPWCRIEDRDGDFLNGTKSNQYVSEKTIKEMNLKVNPVGTVLSASSGASIGSILINTVECCTNQTFIGLVAGNSLYNKYLYYYLSSIIQKLKLLGTGTTLAYISREKYTTMIFPLPPLAEQKRIVDAIEKLLPLCEKLGGLQK